MRRLSASIYQNAKNVGIIGILAYPKIKSKRKRGNRHVPLPFRGKRAENCLHNVEKSLGEGLAGAKIPQFQSFTVSQFQSFFVSCRRTYVLNKANIHYQKVKLTYLYFILDVFRLKFYFILGISSVLGITIIILIEIEFNVKSYKILKKNLFLPYKVKVL